MDKSQMSPSLLRRADWAIAGIVMIIGLAFTITAYSYSLGSIRNIGPGMMPFLIGICLMVAPVFVILRSRYETFEPVATPLLRTAAIIGGVIVWGLTIDRFGLVPATAILMLMASLAYGRIRWVSTLIAIALTTIGSVLVFIYGFKLPFDIVSW